MDGSLSDYWQDGEQVLQLDWVALASSLDSEISGPPCLVTSDCRSEANLAL